METVSFKLDRRHVQLLKQRAEASRRTQAAVVRELIERHLGGKRRRTLHDRARDLCGSVAGSRELSTRKLQRYGRD
jgi:hypothetical protein